MSYIQVIDEYKRYKIGDSEVIANNGISFDIEKGEFVVILGPSGAGKSTVLNILGGMDTCDEGEIIVDKVDISKFNRKQLTEYRRYDVGFVFQFYNLVQNLTTRENIELATQICKDALDVDETLELVGLSHRKDNFPSQLSGGEQQRVSIARAIAKNPKILLCDEPTGALDYKTGKSILKTLQKTCRDTNTTVILITHNSAIAAIADRVIHINDAKVRKIELNHNPLDVDDVEW
ncbi:ABC transporter ATP-binding protein [Mycoplasma sp. P36-A1]|uniref:ABC transporter ATP-binding protein n=1 Tax=Mycoplasma sp. P36-A1 TaxID=3252900 RepID=UPI003C2BFFE2